MVIRVQVVRDTRLFMHLATNAMAVIDAVMRARPAAAKGTYLRSLTVSTTMGPGVSLDAQRISNLYKK